MKRILTILLLCLLTLLTCSCSKNTAKTETTEETESSTIESEAPTPTPASTYTPGDDLYGMLSVTGDVVIEPQYNYLGLFTQENLARFQDYETGLWGYINESGEEVIPAQYEDAQDFSEGLAAVKVDGLYGFINVSGEMVIEPQFEGVGSEFAYERCVIQSGGMQGVIDQTGVSIVKPQYKSIEMYCESYFIVQSSEGEYGIIDRDGEIVVEYLDSEIYAVTGSGYYFVSGSDIEGRDLMCDFAGQVDWNEYLLPSVNILEGEHEYLDYYYLSATVEDNVLKDLEINQTTSRIENVHDAIINSLSDSVSTTVSNYVISKLPFADEINIGIKMTKIAQKAISASMDVVENNTSINIELRQEAAGISVASTGAYVSMIADDTGSVEFQRAYFSPGLLQEKLAYFAYSMNDQTIHTYDEYIIESGSECLIADDLTENYSPDKWINTFVRNGGTEPLDASFNTFCRYLETAWNRYCVDSGNSQYANINIQRLSPVDIIELTMSLEKYGYQEINIDLSKYTQYLEDYN